MAAKQCSIGTHLSEQCTGTISDAQNLKERDRRLISLRTGCGRVSDLCGGHLRSYLNDFFVKAGKKCSNPLGRDHDLPGFDIREITLDLYDKWSVVQNASLVPGKRVCRACRDQLNAAEKNILPPVLDDYCSNMELLEDIYGDEQLGHSEEAGESVPCLSPQVSGLEGEILKSSPTCQGAGTSQGACSTEGSQSLTSEAASKPSSQDIWSIPDNCTQYETVSEIANLLAVDFPARKALKSRNQLLLKLYELQSELKKVTLKIGNVQLKYSDEENPIKVPIDYEDTCIEIFSQIKDKLQTCKSMEEKVQILSVCPVSWSWKHLQTEFEVGRKLATKVKTLVQEQGIFPNVNPRISSRLIKDHDVQTVQKFYLREDVSRQMPGKKDFKSVKIGDKREHKQKRLLLFTLREAWALFKEEHEDCKVGFSKFATLRPPEVVLAGAPGTHSVCVCLIHQNFKLMLTGAKLDNLKDVKINEVPLEGLTYEMLLKKIHCVEPTELCHLQECKFCPGSESCRELLNFIFEERMVERIEYKQWTTTDRSTLITQVQSTEEFVDSLIASLSPLSVHSFVAKQQSKFYQEKKANLKPGEVLVVGDFSENYSFVKQDAVYAFHWNNDQATLHPFAAYTKSAEDEEPVCHSLVVLSNDMKHNTGAVYAFQVELIDFLKKKEIAVEKIIYFSDGAASQYKNKYNAANLLNHKVDFNIEAEWHFFATAHGKGPSDGIGGSFKRRATEASLRDVNAEEILTTDQLYQWGLKQMTAKDNDHEKTKSKITVALVDKEKVEETRKNLSDRFKRAKAVPDIRKQHCLVPMQDNIMAMARVSYGTGLRIVDLNTVERPHRESLEEQEDDPQEILVAHIGDHPPRKRAGQKKEDTSHAKRSCSAPEGAGKTVREPEQEPGTSRGSEQRGSGSERRATTASKGSQQGKGLNKSTRSRTGKQNK